MDFCDLVVSLSPKAAKWDSIGLLLGLSADELETIRANHDTVEQRLRKVLQKWHDRTPHPTWEEVIAALKSPLVGDPALAEKLESKTGSRTDILKENLAKIKQRFARLVGKVSERLERGNIDMKRFRLHISTVFGNVLTGTESVGDIIEAVSCHKLWDYFCCNPIEEIASEFGGDDSELRGWINDYKSELAGYKAATKIVDYIKVCDIEEIADSGQSLRADIKRYDKRYCHKLTVKLKSHITEKSLDYIDQLWMSIADHLLLPTLSALLESIHEGCVEVTWRIPTVSALHIQANIQDSGKFLDKLDDVVRFSMDDSSGA